MPFAILIAAIFSLFILWSTAALAVGGGVLTHDRLRSAFSDAWHGRMIHGLYVATVATLVGTGVFRGWLVLLPGPAANMTVAKAVVVGGGIVNLLHVLDVLRRGSWGSGGDRPRTRAALRSWTGGTVVGAVLLIAPGFLSSGTPSARISALAMACYWAMRLGREGNHRMGSLERPSTIRRGLDIASETAVLLVCAWLALRSPDVALA